MERVASWLLVSSLLSLSTRAQTEWMLFKLAKDPGSVCKSICKTFVRVKGCSGLITQQEVNSVALSKSQWSWRPSKNCLLTLMTFWTFMTFFLWWNVNSEFLKNVLTNIFKTIKSELVLEQKPIKIIKVIHMSKNYIDFFFSMKICKFGLNLMEPY